MTAIIATYMCSVTQMPLLIAVTYLLAIIAKADVEIPSEIEDIGEELKKNFPEEAEELPIGDRDVLSVLDEETEILVEHKKRRLIVAELTLDYTDKLPTGICSILTAQNFELVDYEPRANNPYTTMNYPSIL
ncbi:uncharacterized protein TRIADDRAFT_56031 [Trichoplax adhaerens]|uniref:Uncharacterized protein n=1 Tax=Trichoplax adhaerens TaxID=10228 RepID=B3RTS7_TRIAD|nr:predicted protein [Trichoplax adhaerens]EDV25676.1 predicted protein [Trichoplax adhaerens]|eukprot:XP_002111709.1 predicted protein [Trichoplax adhaerens]